MSKTNKKILIVEDDPSMANALAEKFSREGFEVLKAENGEVGLKSALDNKPDLILLDIIMPRMDGLTMLKKLREEDGEYGQKVPVIVSTNLSEVEKVDESLRIGAFDFLVKSNWKIDDVVKKVKDKLEV